MLVLIIYRVTLVLRDFGEVRKLHGADFPRLVCPLFWHVSAHFAPEVILPGLKGAPRRWGFFTADMKERRNIKIKVPLLD